MRLNQKLYFKLIFLFMILFNIFIPSRGQVKNSVKSNKKIASSYILDVVNDRKLNLINNIFSVEYKFHEMDGMEGHPIQDSSLKSFLKYLFKAFPDLHYTIDNSIAESDLVTLNLTASGTHKDEFLGVPASNNKVIFKEMFLFRIKNSKIIEGWGVVNLKGIIDEMSKK